MAPQNLDIPATRLLCPIHALSPELLLRIFELLETHEADEQQNDTSLASPSLSSASSSSLSQADPSHLPSHPALFRNLTSSLLPVVTQSTQSTVVRSSSSNSEETTRDRSSFSLSYEALRHPFGHALVCSSWYRLARQSRSAIRIRDGRRIESPTLPVQISVSVYPSLTALHLEARSLRQVDDGFLASLASHCRRLTRLTIHWMSHGDVSETGFAALAKGCTRLEQLRFLHGTSAFSLPQPFQLPSLTHLTIARCLNLASLPPNIAQALPSLRELELDGSTTLCCLPLSLVNLPALRRLTLRDLFRLVELPANMGQLPQLRELELDWLISLRRLSDSLGQLLTLERLVLRRCPTLALPEGLDRLPRLKVIITS
ncbi:unnamed protein product [Closterium sp. NIES-54]